MEKANKEVAIRVESLNKTFQLPHDQHSGIKQLIINVMRGKHKAGYEKQHVLKDISFNINKGDFFGIVGRNGSGKSTLLKLLAGIYVPDSGNVQVDGTLVPFIELGVGFNPELTGRENVFLNGALLGFSRKQMEKMYQEIVRFAELERFMDQKLKNYSSGMQVRLAFSIAIRADSDILILDEVLAVGDAAFQQKCFDYFTKLKREGRTVVLVTHDMSSVQRFCNRAIFIKNGEIVVDGKPSDIADLYLEENIEAINAASTVAKSGSKMKLRVVKRDEEKVTIGMSISKAEDFRKYIAISIIKDGMSIGEINSNAHEFSASDVEAEFSIGIKDFNAGVYEVTGVLCQYEGRKLLTVADKSVNFIVKGSDPFRGGAVKLEDTWVINISE
ncbi:MAG: ABC transporter ATP-binding protein [Candidatus Microsaccharimonas sp.]